VKTPERNSRSHAAISRFSAVLLFPLRANRRGACSARARMFAPLALALFSLFTFACTVTQAKQARLFAGTFGGGASTIVNPYPLQAESQLTGPGPHSLAVDTAPGVSQGDVYITDTSAHRVEKFNAKGEFVLMFGKEVNEAEHDRIGLEPGETTQEKEARENVCTLASLDICQPGTAAATPGALEEPSFVAVDDSSGPSEGDVYVDTGSGTESQNEQQQLKFSGASGGTFTLSFEGHKTGPISFNSPELRNEILDELSLLPSIEGGINGVNVNGSSVEIDFGNNLGATNVPQVTVDASGLTPSGASASVSTLVEGGPGTPDVITKFSEDGQLLSSWGSGGQLDGSTAPDGPFLALGGIAVDPSGNLWTIDSFGYGHTAFPRAFEFRQDGGFLTSWSGEVIGVGQDPPLVGRTAGGLAVDSRDDLYFGVGAGLLLEFDPTGTLLGSVDDPRPAPGGEQNVGSYAVDSSDDDLFVAVEPTGLEGSEVQRYAGSACSPRYDFSNKKENVFCNLVESFGAGRFGFMGGPYTGITVDSSSPAHSIYVLGSRSGEATAFSIKTVPDVATAQASGFTPTTAVLNGTVNPSGEGLTGCFFEWGETEAYGEKTPCAEGLGEGHGEIDKGTAPVEVHANIAGLVPGHTYHFRLVATNQNTDLAKEPSRGSDLAFGPPLIESGSALSVAAISATLQIQVDPNNVDTHARIEYGTHAGAYPNVTPEVDLGAAGSVQSHTIDLQGLEPDTTYHYRVSAESILGSPQGPDLAFTTQSAAGANVLPDDRAYELVSPPNKHGSPLETLGGAEGFGAVLQAAADGDGLAYTATGSIGAGAPGNRATNPSQLLAIRGGVSSSPWNTADITTPHRAAAGLLVGSPSEYQLFSTDLSLAVVQPIGATPLSPQTSEPTPYRREADGTYTPLVNAGNVPAGTEFGGKESAPEAFGEGGVGFVTATTDLEHILLESPKVLTSEFAPGSSPTTAGPVNLYEWSAGALRLVSQIPPGSASACGGSSPGCLPASEVGHASSILGSIGAHGGVRHAISADGSRVVFGTSTSPTKSYLRDLAREETIRLDAPEPGCTTCKSGGGFSFQDASVDGSRIFFTDDARLTADSTAGGESGGPDLYMCQVEESEGHLACSLTDLTANAVNPAEPATVQGLIGGVSEDGSSVYFVADGALTSGEGAVHGDCGSVAGQCNLYRYDVETHSTRLIAVLAGADGNDWASRFYELTARVSPNGRWLAFMSERSLTGYDNRDAVSGERDEEVFLYDSQAEGGKGKLICASCTPTGARPSGVEGLDRVPSQLVDSTSDWKNRWFAANIPVWTTHALGESLYQSRYLSDSGRLFFDSSDALVSSDTNGTEDVYQYEPPGVGGCTEQSLTFSLSSEGCIGLVSSGSSPEESAFLDASESGDDVFFMTDSRLTAKDVDAAFDIYDARVGGGEAPPPPLPACEGDACQNPVAAPNDPTPGSLTFQGPGNAKPVPAGPVVKKCKVNQGKCVKNKSKHSKKTKKQKTKKRKKAKKAKRANNYRRTGR
jgi:hypothetical protein